jgi:hypothetical protein
MVVYVDDDNQVQAVYDNEPRGTVWIDRGYKRIYVPLEQRGTVNRLRRNCKLVYEKGIIVDCIPSQNPIQPNRDPAEVRQAELKKKLNDDSISFNELKELMRLGG